MTFADAAESCRGRTRSDAEYLRQINHKRFSVVPRLSAASQTSHAVLMYRWLQMSWPCIRVLSRSILNAGLNSVGQK